MPPAPIPPMGGVPVAGRFAPPPRRPSSPPAAAADSDVSPAAESPVRSGTDTETGATGGSAETPAWAAPGTEVDGGAIVPTPDSSPPGPPNPAKLPPVSDSSSVRTVTSSARADRSRALSWSSATVSRWRMSSVSAWPRVTLPRSSSSDGLKTRCRDSPTTSCGTAATVVQARSSSFCDDVISVADARRQSAIRSAREVKRSRWASTCLRCCS